MVGGLSFQVVSLIIFMGLSLDFIIAARKAWPNDLDAKFTTTRRRRMFRLFPYFIALATITVFIRCCFRVAELKDGFGSKLANDQALFMVFEGPMIMIAVLALSICHPGVAFGGAEAWRAANWTWKKRANGRNGVSMEESIGSNTDSHAGALKGSV